MNLGDHSQAEDIRLFSGEDLFCDPAPPLKLLLINITCGGCKQEKKKSRRGRRRRRRKRRRRKRRRRRRRRRRRKRRVLET